MSAILSQEVQSFINENIGNQSSKIAFQKNPFPNINWQEVITQIVSKTKAKNKLPTWFSAQNIIYPAKISIEQTSSEITAQYKSTIVSGKSLIDLTGGFGVDDYYFAKKINQVTHCELDIELSEIVKLNYIALKQSNINCLQGDSLSILQNLEQKFEWIYIDPSRRNDIKGKVFLLKDCLPNVPDLLDIYFKYSNSILIKTAPILDISAGLSELKFVKTIHIVAVNNEVKELLWEIEKDYNKNTKVKTINISSNKEEFFEFLLNSSTTKTLFSLPKKNLYEPNSAILKSGAFNLLTSHFKIEKLHPHSHLYTSDELISFPGRRFEIKNAFEYNKINMKKFLEKTKTNVTTRNFKETVEEIRKKWKISDGGSIYTFFTTDINNKKIVLLCAKI